VHVRLFVGLFLLSQEEMLGWERKALGELWGEHGGLVEQVLLEEEACGVVNALCAAARDALCPEGEGRGRRKGAFRGRGGCALLVGPPGSGKSSLASAVARSSGLPYRVVHAPDVFLNNRTKQQLLQLLLLLPVCPRALSPVLALGAGQGSGAELVREVLGTGDKQGRPSGREGGRRSRGLSRIVVLDDVDIILPSSTRPNLPRAYLAHPSSALSLPLLSWHSFTARAYGGITTCTSTAAYSSWSHTQLPLCFAALEFPLFLS